MKRRSRDRSESPVRADWHLARPAPYSAAAPSLPPLQLQSPAYPAYSPQAKPPTLPPPSQPYPLDPAPPHSRLSFPALPSHDDRPQFVAPVPQEGRSLYSAPTSQEDRPSYPGPAYQEDRLLNPASKHSDDHLAYERLPQPPSATQDDRIRRNVACTKCRDSKVRCLPSAVPGGPCQRCVKLCCSSECRFDKGHKRRTKANKLELLEKELNTIKQQVETHGGPSSTSHDSTSPSTRTASTSGPVSTTSWPSPRPRPIPIKDYTPPVSASRHVPAQVVSPRSESTAPQTAPEGMLNRAVCQERTLGKTTLSGDDIEFYFRKYIQFYHPFLPILRHKEPDSCYKAHPILFWTIIYVSCRRFCRDETVFEGLVDELSTTPWLMLSTASATLESIHALLIICNWPLPNIRFLTDPCPSLLAVATVACMQLGLHLGRGTGEDFGCGERSNARCTDEEASYTWLSCCMLATKASTAAGIPPPSIQYDHQRCRKSLDNSSWDELKEFFELQKWLNRFHSAMAAQLAGGLAITAATVSFWETEFDAIRPSLVHTDTDLLQTALLSARLEIKTYYLTNPLLPMPPSLASHIRSLFTTARALLNHLSTLDSASNHLRHHPQWSFRALLDACMLIIFCLHQRSACCPQLSDTEATEVAREAWSAVARCSVRDGDIPQKVSSFMETFWRIREKVPKGEIPVSTWRNRLAVGVTFWCLKVIKIALVDAKILPDDTKIGTRHIPERSSTTGGNPSPTTPADKGVDDFLGVDWSFLIEDIGWSATDM